jgi:hypothetical protein
MRGAPGATGRLLQQHSIIPIYSPPRTFLQVGYYGGGRPQGSVNLRRFAALEDSVDQRQAPTTGVVMLQLDNARPEASHARNRLHGEVPRPGKGSADGHPAGCDLHCPPHTHPSRKAAGPRWWIYGVLRGSRPRQHRVGSAYRARRRAVRADPLLEALLVEPVSAGVQALRAGGHWAEANGARIAHGG